MSIGIRKARIEDAPRLAELWHEMAKHHAKRGEYFRIKRGSTRGFRERMEKLIDEGKSGIFLAQVGREVVGFVTAEAAQRSPCFIHRMRGHIGNLAVTARWRRKGVGERLYRRALAWIAAQGIPVAEAHVAVENPMAVSFWTKMGFRPYMAMMKRDVPRASRDRGSPGPRSMRRRRPEGGR